MKKLSIFLFLFVAFFSTSVNSKAEEDMGRTCCIAGPSDDYVCHVIQYIDPETGDSTFQFIPGIEIQCPYV